MAQACGTVTTCPTASMPLSGSELLYLVQGGVSKKITVGSIFGVGSVISGACPNGYVLYNNASRIGCEVPASGTRMQVDNLTVTATNTTSGLSQTPSGGLMALSINGQLFTNAGGSPAFTVSGTTITWSAANSGLTLQTTFTAQAIYTY